ncbi:hypothetical protein, variant [Sphaeroforma arctica JP610]|uniref:RGS domain-containing protein n=1 Tax=Sphaeroforma arctica JP610 TaxID=667725 RepID=A0A0L0GAJ1_9EUKA|nr:hypothetical protein, variant [Sphaeroforma arctica JP610]KNC86042.1 hypothetical protein, variant [Sphaeroforma arctica JP610]|eukprot:XP_014159945.1 hypothetical protein, variant [Sphaeroforma arctica JP610]
MTHAPRANSVQGDKNHASKVKQSGRRSKALAKSCSSMLNVASACELHVPARRSSIFGPRPVRDSMSTPRLAEVLSFREDNYPTARVDFVRYTRARACEENVLFLMEFEKFHTLVERTRGQDKYHELVMAIAVKIVDDYVHDQALHPLNIDSKLKTQVLGYILDCDLENIILSLSSIAKEIVAILEYGVWEQFVEWRRSQ